MHNPSLKANETISSWIMILCFSCHVLKNPPHYVCIGSINSLRPSDTIGNHRVLSTFAQVMAWYHLASSYHCNQYRLCSWWRHQMKTFSASMAICAGNSPVTGEFPAQRPVTRSIDVFFDLHLNERLSKQSWGWGFETPSRPLWRQIMTICAEFYC